MTREPTERQLELHRFMLAYQAEHGMPPTLREIAEAFGFASVTAAHAHMVLMAKKGLVKHRPKTARGWLALPLSSPATESAA